MSWNLFIYFALTALCCWWAGAWAAWKGARRLACGVTTVGLTVFLIYIIGMWASLERPPLRTMGETRLWYSFFLPLVGVIIYSRWRHRWMLTFSSLMATVFTTINLLRPEIHDKVLMPALQSIWFAPHVIIYMFAYALLGAAFCMAVYLIWFRQAAVTSHDMSLTDSLVSAGLACITIGMLLGALWAKQAWGHYWTWDPKETWAAITWLSYIVYIHYRRVSPRNHEQALAILIFAFIFLQMCWWGIRYLPAAQGASIHVYG